MLVGFIALLILGAIYYGLWKAYRKFATPMFSDTTPKCVKEPGLTLFAVVAFLITVIFTMFNSKLTK